MHASATSIVLNFSAVVFSAPTSWATWSRTSATSASRTASGSTPSRGRPRRLCSKRTRYAPAADARSHWRTCNAALRHREARAPGSARARIREARRANADREGVRVALLAVAAAASALAAGGTRPRHALRRRCPSRHLRFAAGAAPARGHRSRRRLRGRGALPPHRARQPPPLRRRRRRRAPGYVARAPSAAHAAAAHQAALGRAPASVIRPRAHRMHARAGLSRPSPRRDAASRHCTGRLGPRRRRRW